MPAYLLVDIKIHDPAAFAEYSREVPELVAKHGGEYLVRGGAHETLEGLWNPTRLILIRFPDRQAIRNLMSDPKYQPLKQLRLKTSSGNFVAVEGI